MGFKRNWDSSCPRIWNQWEENGKLWVIQDLPPEDDETALQLFLEYMCPDEPLCAISNVIGDEASMKGIGDFWRECIALRTTLACYTEVEGQRKLVGLNICVVDTVGETVPDIAIEGEAWKNVYGALIYIEEKCDPYKHLELDSILHALGLCVSRECRGARIGSKLLSAREPLCKDLGIKGTATVFTGPASQKSAARAGFSTICEVTLKELAEHGYRYPHDESRSIKLMIKKYD